VEKYYKQVKDANPSVPILIREASNVPATVWGRFGERMCVSVCLCCCVVAVVVFLFLVVPDSLSRGQQRPGDRVGPLWCVVVAVAAFVVVAFVVVLFVVPDSHP
jgi:hypothetical protein